MALFQLLHVQHAQLTQLLGSHLGLLVQVEHFDLPVYKFQDGRDCEVELQCIQYVHFHVQHIVLGLRLVGDLDKVSHLWRIDLLLFACYKHTGDAYQL
jgi:hypothetical protein